MGILAESFDDLPTVENLPCASWDDVPDLPSVLERYEIARDLLIGLDAQPPPLIPSDVLSTGQNALREVKNALRQLALQIADPANNTHHSTITRFGQQINSVYQNLVRHAPHIHIAGIDWVGHLEAARDARAAAEESQARAAEVAASLDALEARAKTLVEQIGVGELAKHYGSEADEQASSARRWLWAVIVSGVLLLAVVVWLFIETHGLGANPSWEQIARSLASKALAIGVVSYAVTFCSRNFRSHRHLEAVYRQRKASLNTYSAMASALQEDDEGRKVVLAELAKAVFAATDTGMTPSSAGDKTIIENTVPIVSALRTTA